MNKILFLVALLSLFFAKGFAQESKIENTQLQLSGDNLIITYDVVGSSSLDNVWLEIKTTSNKMINAKTLSGDIGKKILAGRKKKIVWNMKADGIDLQGEELNVKVLAFKPKSLTNELTDIVEIERGMQSKSRDKIVNKDGSKITGKLESRFATSNMKFVSADGNYLTLNPDEIEKINNKIYSKDTVYLKNGDIVCGTIKEIFPNNKITIQSIKNDRYSIQNTDIKSISTYSSNLSYYGKSYYAMPIIQVTDPLLFGLKFGIVDDLGYYGQFSYGDYCSIYGIGASKYIYSVGNIDIHATLGLNYSSIDESYSGYTKSLGFDGGFIGQYRHFVFNLGFGVPFKDNGLSNITFGFGYSLSAIMNSFGLK